MRDLLWMLGMLVAGAVNTLAAAAFGGLACAGVVALAAGWAMAQHDHNYQRVRGEG